MISERVKIDKRDVFLSLLALVSYNRGYGQNVGGLAAAGGIGNATIQLQSNTTDGSDEVEAGFYAIAYEWNGETTISYHGTNSVCSSPLPAPTNHPARGIAQAEA